MMHDGASAGGAGDPSGPPPRGAGRGPGAVEALEALLGAYPGAVLLASHDRRLVAHVATRVWYFTTVSGWDGRSVVRT